MKTYLRVLETIEAAGVKAWLVGDPVRDVVMGIQPSALSVVTNSSDLKSLMASLGDGTIMGVDAFPVLHISILGAKVEISSMRGDSIEEDLARRDFSINSIAIRSDDGFVDPFNGRHDIRNGLLRLSGDDIDLVRSDPIRIVRMLRFASELDMKIFWKSDADIRAFIEKSPDQIKNTPAERWGREILSGMTRRPFDFIYLCDRYHLIPLFLPDFEELKNIQINSELNLFDHTLDTLKITQKFLMSRKRRENDMAFALATLFHHGGAVLNQPIDPVKSAAIATKYMKAWNINADTIDLVTNVITQYRLLYDERTEEQLCAAVLESGFAAMDLILDFAICNSQAASMNNMEVVALNKWKLGEVVRRFEETKRRTSGSLRYLSGGEVMKTLDIKPGRVVGEILEELDMAVGMGVVSSKKEATDWIVKRGAGGGK